VSTFRIYDKLRAVPRESFVMFDDGSRQSLLDDEHLRLLALGYQIEGGVSACFSLFGLLYVVMGVGMTSGVCGLAVRRNWVLYFFCAAGDGVAQIPSRMVLKAAKVANVLPSGGRNLLPRYSLRIDPRCLYVLSSQPQFRDASFQFGPSTNPGSRKLNPS
jgi:DNA-binding transcriptional LysR family regulator